MKYLPSFHRQMEAWIADGVRRQGWTTTKPTEPGWYWVVWRTHAPDRDLVYHNGRGGMLFLGWPEKDSSAVPHMHFSHFLGPLPVPEPPEGG